MIIELLQIFLRLKKRYGKNKSISRDSTVTNVKLGKAIEIIIKIDDNKQQNALVCKEVIR